MYIRELSEMYRIIGKAMEPLKKTMELLSGQKDCFEGNGLEAFVLKCLNIKEFKL